MSRDTRLEKLHGLDQLGAAEPAPANVLYYNILTWNYRYLGRDRKTTKISED